MPTLRQCRYLSANEKYNWPDAGLEYTNIMGSGEETSKISIMAPPGTVVQLVGRGIGAKRLIIGASGIYDFDVPEIKIQEISFPKAPSEDGQRAMLRSYIRNLRDSLKVIMNAMPDTDQGETMTPALYQQFCENMKELIIKGCPPSRPSDYGTSLKTLSSIVLEYLGLVEDSALGNTGLSNIIVNYTID